MTLAAASAATPVGAGRADLLPPGERYFRHAGDVVRLVLWASASLLLGLAIWRTTSTVDGLTADLGRAAVTLPLELRELALAFAQVAAVAVPIGVLAALLWQHRWRRIGVLLLAAALGAGLFALVDALLALPERPEGAVSDGTWLADPTFPSLAYVAAAFAAVSVGKPWMGRAWRRAGDVSLFTLGAVMLLAGSAGAPALLLALAVGSAAGSGLLVLLGAPNRRPAPADVLAALEENDLVLSGLDLVRADGGRAQHYVADRADGGRLFVKVYSQDSRDADVVYRGYRALMLRGAGDDWPSASLAQGVEHEAVVQLLARQGGVACPRVEFLAALHDGSVLLAYEFVDGVPLDTVPAEAISDELLDATWSEVRRLHRLGLAHRALRAANVLVSRPAARAENAAGTVRTGGGGALRPVLIDLGFGLTTAPDRPRAVDLTELLVSLAVVVGPERAVASARRVLGPAGLAPALPYLQPLALSAATRKAADKALLKELRAQVQEAAEVEAVPLERLVRVRPRTLLMVAVAVGAFYVLLPQLANVDDSFDALRSAAWGWLVASALLSILTYVASAVGIIGGVPGPVPFLPTVGAQLASSFVNRVTPANVGGMALNVRFLRKAGIEPAEAVTGVGLNSLTGGVTHLGLLAVFFALARNDDSGSGTGFSLPSTSRLLVVIAVVLALAGVVSATSRGRRLFRRHVVRFVKDSLVSLARVARSPMKLAALVGGSTGVTLAYIASLAAAVAAFHGDVSFIEVGAVYLGSRLIAAAAPTPGGLGALEAALVAGFTGVGMDPGAAVAAVLSYRLVTYWLPILPGWASFQLLERKGLI